MSKATKQSSSFDAITAVHPDLVVVCGKVHCKSQEALDAVLKFLQDDYEIEDKNLANGKHELERPRDTYWVKLKDSVLQNAVKCRLCKAYSSNRGCKVHGFRCSNCGEVLFQEYMPGGTIEFCFSHNAPGHENDFNTYVKLRIHSYDSATECILCYPAYVKSRRAWREIGKQKHDEILARHQDDYEVVYLPAQGQTRGNNLVYLPAQGQNRRNTRRPKDKVKLLSFYYPRARYDEEGDKKSSIRINMSEVQYPRKFDWAVRYDEVKLFKGREFSGGLLAHDNLPLPEHFHVEPTFRHPFKRNGTAWARILQESGVISRPNYYYSDGTQGIHDFDFARLTRFVENFTDLPLDEWKSFLQICPLDGPGFIVALAAWVDHITGIRQNLGIDGHYTNSVGGHSYDYVPWGKALVRHKQQRRRNPIMCYGQWIHDFVTVGDAMSLDNEPDRRRAKEYEWNRDGSRLSLVHFDPTMGKKKEAV